ncbi:unnamed protein product [Brassica oleracea var. botrytis]
MTSSFSKVTEQLSFYLPNHSLTQLTPSLISFKSYSGFLIFIMTLNLEFGPNLYINQGIPRVRHKDFSIPIAKVFKKKTTTELVSDRCLKFTGEIYLRRP